MRGSHLVIAAVLIGISYLTGVQVAKRGGQVADERSAEQVVAPPPNDDLRQVPFARDLWEALKDEDKQELGSPDAPLLMVIFMEESCQECRAFQQDILPRLKVKYLDPGKLRIWNFPMKGVAQAAQVAVNPTFFIANDKIEGWQPWVTFESLIEKNLANSQ